MKKGLRLGLVFLFVLLLINSCTNKSNPAQISLDSTPTLTPTPDFDFSFYLYADKTPVVGRNIFLLPPNSQPTITTSTDGYGRALFVNLNNSGSHIFVVPAHNGYSDKSYTVDAPSNTSIAIDYSSPILNLVNTSGNANVGIIGGTIEYTLIYTTPIDKEISFDVIGIPSSVSYTVSTRSLQHNGDTSLVKFYINTSQDDWQTFNFYVYASDTAATVNNYISNNAILTRAWQFNTSVVLAVGQNSKNYYFKMTMPPNPSPFCAHSSELKDGQMGWSILNAYATGATIGQVTATMIGYNLDGQTVGGVTNNISKSFPLRNQTTLFGSVITKNAGNKINVGSLNYVLLHYTDGNLLNITRKYSLKWNGGSFIGQDGYKPASNPCNAYFENSYYASEIIGEGVSY